MELSLADVMPSVAAGFGLDGPNPFAVRSGRDVVVLLIDGLGSELLARSADDAPTLAAHVSTTLRAGFPATTATSLTSLAVGAPCAVHGVIGYSFAVPAGADEDLRTLNALRWTFDSAAGPDARADAEPESVQPMASGLERLATHDVDIHYVVPGYQAASGLTRAAFRATGTVHPAATLDEVRDGILDVARMPGRGRRFTYAYYPGLDMAGHLHGPGSTPWREQLRAVDATVAELFDDLPSTCTLLVTGDHGMISAGTLIDLDAAPELQYGVRLIAGEARVRHVYLESAAARDDVVGAWTSTLGEHARVVTREQAFDERWFGAATPGPAIAARIGDVVAVAEGDAVLVRPEAEPLESTMIGHHGAWTADEQLVPLVVNP
ncbi:alkaline phosphatase family protein [Gordonia sp. HY285]|uniref:alkaline phosphatase family protein n=1 Tax=Gordonia liuliyuniae TaxID=2911517 RepID=UPI001F35FF46|nr:nucleotide pyrophosphatase/phosphodiesterase family protein [Gordonia liuliyuniae]MCF8610373.1 alkaline phosphatase family protein [Gordonia liuliyuniae]